MHSTQAHGCTEDSEPPWEAGSHFLDGESEAQKE